MNVVRLDPEQFAQLTALLTEIRDSLRQPSTPRPTTLTPGGASIFGYVAGQTEPPTRIQVAGADDWVERRRADPRPYLAIEGEIISEILHRRFEAPR
jgi:hypothetical protein